MYSVKEIFYTLQGEGARAGSAAVFLRFAGCNLWSGREVDRDRAPGTCSRWCDTDFVGTDGKGGGRLTADQIAQRVADTWRGGAGRKLVVCTGGEPLLQLDHEVVALLHGEGFEVAVETNGTSVPPRWVDWVCVSPKAGSDLVVRSGNELKVVWPQALDLDALGRLDFRHFFLQPMDGPDRDENTRRAVEYCLAHPQWRLSLQTHKYLGIP
jgi:7-carboxy-7-deazaguanine synthase (Cx14CxxC type)